MRKFIFFAWLIVWLSACGTASPHPATQFPTLPGELTPYISATPSSTPSPLPAVVTVALTPIPTATPFTHTIAKDDTMLGIALRYGVTLEELQAANPDVDPGFLVIGNTLVIPIEGQSSGEIPIPTPLPVPWSAPKCYQSGEGGLWCYIIVTNDQPAALENLAAWVSLYDSQANLLGGQAAVAPLNRLPSGASMPLVAYFPPPLEDELIPQGQLLSVLTVENESTRYIDAAAKVDTVEIAETGSQAEVKGQIMIPQGDIPSVVWLVLVAYDIQGDVVGMRKFDLGAVCGIPPTPLASFTPQPTPGTGTPTFTPTPSATASPKVVCAHFEYAVYSLGPAIQRVEVLLEARP